MLVFGVVESGIQFFRILGQFSDMLVHFQSLETVFTESAVSRIISRLTTDPGWDGTVRIIDGLSLEDMTVE